jgi:hypothetical protein
MKNDRWFHSRIFAIPLKKRKFEKGTKGRSSRPLLLWQNRAGPVVRKNNLFVKRAAPKGLTRKPAQPPEFASDYAPNQNPG